MMKIVIVQLSKRTFSDALEGVNSKHFPLASLGLPLLLLGECPKLSAYTMYDITGI